MSISRSDVTRYVPFAFASVFTGLAYATLWATEGYWLYLSLLGALSAVFATMILRQTGLKLLPTLLVAVGLLVGQWWLVQILILRLSWNFSGFAP